MSRRKFAVDVAIAASAGFVCFYIWNILRIFSLYIYNFRLPAPALVHFMVALCDGLFAAALGLGVGSALGRLLGISSRAFLIAVGFGLALALVVTITTDNGVKTTISLLQQVAFWVLPISAWLGFAHASRRKAMRNAA